MPNNNNKKQVDKTKDKPTPMVPINNAVDNESSEDELAPEEKEALENLPGFLVDSEYLCGCGGKRQGKGNAFTSAPCLECTLRFHPVGCPDNSFDVAGLIDTGASAIAFPLRLLEALDVPVQKGGIMKVMYADREVLVDRVTAKLVVTIGTKSREVEVVGLDIVQPLFGTKLFELFKLSLNYPKKELYKAGSRKSLPIKLTNSKNTVGVKHVILNKPDVQDYISVLDQPVVFRLREGVVLKPNTTHQVNVSCGSSEHPILDVKGDKHLFVDKFVKVPNQITSTKEKSLLVTNFSNRVTYLRKGTTVGYGFGVEEVIEYDIIPDGCDHPEAQENSRSGFVVIPKERVIKTEPLNLDCRKQYLRENYDSLVTRIKLEQPRKRNVRMGRVFDDNTPEENLKFFGECLSLREAKVEEEPSINSFPETEFGQMDWTEFNIHDKLSPEELHAVKKLLFRFRHSFAYRKMDLATADRSRMPEADIDTGDNQPIRSSYIRRSIRDKSIIESEVKKMLDQKVIAPSNSPWSSPVVIVTKKNGDVRFCCDYRRLNKITKKDSWPLPRIDEALDTLGGSSSFTTLDMSSGYWMIPLSKQAQEKTAFITHMGLYEWKVLPFGLTAAPAKYQRMMDLLLSKLKWKTCCLYLDDVCVFGNTFWKQLKNLEEVLTTLASVGLKLNPKKCFFAMEEIEYLGHRIAKDGIRPSKSKLGKIAELVPPQHVSGLRSFLGLVGYYRNFILNFAKKASPLFKLLKQDVPWEWTPACQEAFEYLRDSLVKEPVCAHYDASKEHAIFVDACAKGIGAILKQEEEDEKGKKIWKVVSYWGRSLLPAETRYPATELEMLGLVNACHHFRCYVHGKRFKVFTDHRALLAITGKGLCQGGVYNRRVNTWQMKLSDFDMEIIYKPGCTHQDADFISRMDQDVKESVEGNEDKMFFDRTIFNKYNFENFVPPQFELPKYQEDDALVQYKRKLLKQPGHPAHKKYVFDVDSNLLYRKIRGNSKEELTLAPVVPHAKKEEVLLHYHDSVYGGHRGVRKTKIAIRNAPLWWPRLDRDVEDYIRTCEKCQFKKPSGIVEPPPTSLLEKLPYKTMKPFECISMDMIDFNHLPSYRKRYVIMAICLLTGYVTTEAIAAPTATAVADFFIKNFVQEGQTPRWILTDRAPNLTKGVMNEVCKKLGIKQEMTARYNPRCNGKCERANGTFKRMLKFYVSKSHKDWSLWVKQIALVMNTTVSVSTGFSPYFLARGREPRLPIDNNTGSVIFDPEQLKPGKGLPADMEIYWQKAREKLISEARKWADKPRKKIIPVFEEGQQVLVLEMIKEQGKLHSLLDIYSQHVYTVVRKTDFHTYIVVNNDDPTDIRTCPVNQLRRFYRRSPRLLVRNKDLLEEDND